MSEEITQQEVDAAVADAEEALGVLEAGRALEKQMLEQAPPTFELSGGTTVRIKRVNRVFAYKVRNAAREKLIQTDGGELQPPSYTVDLAGGEVETHTHNADSIKLEPWCNDADVQDAWSSYDAQQFRLQYEEVRSTVRAYALRGVVEEGPPQEWIDEQSYFGLDVPDNAYDLKWAWLWDQSTGWDELVMLARAVQLLPDPTELAALAAAESFRASVGTATDALADDSEEAGSGE